MSVEINIKDKLNFEDIDLIAPEKIVEAYVKQIDEATNGIVKCTVNPYDGQIETYTTAPLRELVVITQETKHDIQKELGPIGYKPSRFEMYYTAPSLPHYRFRILFFEYGIGGYPVKVVLEQSIANAIKGDNYTYIAKNRTEFETLLGRIISSSKSIEILQDLINATKIAKSRETEGESSDENGV